jgi:hypothetical protein
METDEKEIQLLTTILDDFRHSTFLSFVSDICFTKGLQSQLTIGDPETTGGLLVGQTFPTVQTIEVVYHDSGPLTKSDLQDYIDNFEQTPHSELTIISREQPSSDMRAVADDHDIGLLGLADVAQEVTVMAALEVVANYVEDDEELLANHTSTLVDIGYYSGSRDSPSRGGSVGVSNQFLELELLGYDMYTSNDNGTSGMLVAMEAKAKACDLDFDVENFTFHATDEYAFSGVNRDRHDDESKELVVSLNKALTGEWSDYVYGLEVPAGGRVKFVVYFPVQVEKTLSRIRYKADKLGNLLDCNDEEIKSTFGIPKHSNEDSDMGSWDTYAFEFSLRKDLQEEYRGLPAAVEKGLASIE